MTVKQTPDTTTALTLRLRRLAAIATALVVLAACGGDDPQAGSVADTTPAISSPGNPTAPSPAATTGSTSASTSTTSAATLPPPSTTATNASTTPPTSTGPGSAAFEAQVRTMLEASLEPGFYTAAPDVPPDALPSGASVGIRMPGEPDLIVGIGTEASPPGAAFDPTAPFATGGVTENMLYAIYDMLVDDGRLDPSSTLATWLPSYPNADQITLDMLRDPQGLHGMATIDNWVELVTADYTREWTLDEILAEAAKRPAATVGEPGDSTTAETALLLVLERSTGKTFGQLLDTQLVQPLELSSTAVIDPDQLPAGFSHGRFYFPGQGAFTTADVPLNSYYSFKIAGEGVMSTLADELTIAEALATGTVPGFGRLPTTDKFPSDREVSDDDGTRYLGDGFPLNLHCPCEAVGDGNSGTSIGRRTNALGTTTHWYHFPATGITIVLHMNSYESGTSQEVMQFAYAIHELVSGEPTPPE